MISPISGWTPVFSQSAPSRRREQRMGGLAERPEEHSRLSQAKAIELLIGEGLLPHFLVVEGELSARLRQRLTHTGRAHDLRIRKVNHDLAGAPAVSGARSGGELLVVETVQRAVEPVWPGHEDLEESGGGEISVSRREAAAARGHHGVIVAVLSV